MTEGYVLGRPTLLILFYTLQNKWTADMNVLNDL